MLIYYWTVNGGRCGYLSEGQILVVLLHCWIQWRNHQVTGLCYADETNYKGSCFTWIFLWEIPTVARLSWNIIWSSKPQGFLEARFKASQPGHSKLQALKCPACCVKPSPHAWSYWIIWGIWAKSCKRALLEAGCRPDVCNFQIKKSVLPHPATCLRKGSQLWSSHASVSSRWQGLAHASSKQVQILQPTDL